MRSREIGLRPRAIVFFALEQANLLPVAGLAWNNALGRARSYNCPRIPFVHRALFKWQVKSSERRIALNTNPGIQPITPIPISYLGTVQPDRRVDVYLDAGAVGGAPGP